MAISIEEYKQRLAAINKGGANTNFMKWEKGPNIGRVLPGHPNMEAFYEEKKEHKKGKDATFVSVPCFESDCLICPELEQYRKSKDKEDKEIWKEQQPKSRFFFNFLSRGPEGKTPPELKQVGTGPQILTGIMELLCDEEFGESIIDPGPEGRDVNIEQGVKKGTKQAEYSVKPRLKTKPALPDEDELAKLLESLYDFTTMQDDMDPEKAKLVWDEGWEALKDSDKDEEDAKPKAKDKSPAAKSPLHAVVAAKQKASTKKPIAPEPEEDEEETPDVTSFPRLKSRCSVCGEQRHKTPSGPVCPNGHGGVPPLAEDERPSKPSKKYLKEFPAPVEDEEEEEDAVEDEEEDDDIPSEAAKGGDDDEDLGDLDTILKQHTKPKKK